MRNFITFVPKVRGQLLLSHLPAVSLVASGRRVFRSGFLVLRHVAREFRHFGRTLRVLVRITFTGRIRLWTHISTLVHQTSIHQEEPGVGRNRRTSSHFLLAPVDATSQDEFVRWNVSSNRKVSMRSSASYVGFMIRSLTQLNGPWNAIRFHSVVAPRTAWFPQNRVVPPATTLSRFLILPAGDGMSCS